MASEFLSRNGEIYRILLQNSDICWMISFDNSTERPFSAAAAEMGSFQRVSAPQDSALASNHSTPVERKRLALIQPLLERNMDAITDRAGTAFHRKGHRQTAEYYHPPGLEIVLPILGNRAGGVL